MVDNESPAGSWQREWDARPHTTEEYRQEIRELRERLRTYLLEVERLKAELMVLQARDARWVQEP